MSTVHAVKRGHAATSHLSTFSGAALNSTSLGSFAAKELKLTAPVKAQVERGAKIGDNGRSSWFSADWFVAGAWRMEPKALQAAMSKGSTAKQLLGELMLKVVDTSMIAEDAKTTDADFSAKPIKAGAIIPAILKQTVLSEAEVMGPGMGYSLADVIKERPDRAAFTKELRGIVSAFAHGAPKLYAVSWYNGDDTTYNAYIALNPKSGELRVLENGTTG